MEIHIKVKCPMCGAPINRNSRECHYCGSMLIATSIESFSMKQVHEDIVSEKVANCKLILQSDPENAGANYAMGLYYLHIGLDEAAITHLKKASLASPEIPEIHYTLGLAHFNDGNFIIGSDGDIEAKKEFEYTLKINPDFKEAIAFKHFFLARTLSDVDIEGSIKEYHKAIEACPEISTFHNNLALCYHETKQHSKASETYHRAFELQPDGVIILVNYTLLCFDTKKYDDGVKYGKKAIAAIKPSTKPEIQGLAYNNLALNQYESRNKQEAIRNFKKAASLSPYDPIIQQNLQKAEASFCFIATAAFGTPFTTEVDHLRVWRDRFLLNNNLGLLFVDSYYRISPAIADYIGKSEYRRYVIRVVLRPIVNLIRNWRY